MSLPDAEVLEIVVTKKTRVVRYFDIEPGVENPGFRYSEFSGGWATVESEVAGLTPQQIKGKLALRDTPKYRVDVLLEPGDVVYISVAGPQSNFKELGGGLQIELPRWTLPSEKANSPSKIISCVST